MYILINYCTFLHHLHMYVCMNYLYGMELCPSSKYLLWVFPTISYIIWSILMHFNCLFWLQLTFVMRLEGDIVLLVQHLDKCTWHEALHQTLFAVHVILVDGWAFGDEDDLQSKIYMNKIELLSSLWPWLTSLALRFNSVWSFASYEHSTRARCIWSVLTCSGMDWFGLWPPPALGLLLFVPAPPRDPAALDLLPTSCRSSGTYGVGPPKLRDAERF